MTEKTSQNPPGMLDQGEQKEHNRTYNFFCWLFLLGVWGIVIAGIVLYFVKSYTSNTIYVALGIVYFIYLILEFCSPTSRYLLHKRKDQHMYEKMGKLFKTPPEIQFHCECYHYRTVHYTTRTKYGVQHHTRQEKVVTHRETFDLPYYSERDVSGLFYLNCDAAYVQSKHYIKLKLKEEINFADEVSYMDYENEKEKFWERNRFRDRYFNFWETREIPGLTHHNLVKLTENEPVFVNYFFFFICVILTFCEVYKSWINFLCVYQKFTVRKLVSTRYNLNKPAYHGFIPQLNFLNQKFNYQPEYYNYINNDHRAQMPTPAELEKAKKYKDKIPKYQLSNNYGVVVGNPGYSNYDPNQPPPAFASVAGEVALDDNQVNASGALPQGFGQPGFQFNISPSAPSADEQLPPPPQYPPPAQFTPMTQYAAPQQFPHSPQFPPSPQNPYYPFNSEKQSLLHRPQ